ncbi:hypothetical protein T492DRAFT_850890, partial [Pavlovales sp. CCMP2436]
MLAGTPPATAPEWEALPYELWLHILAHVELAETLGACACAGPFFARGDPDSLVEQAATRLAGLHGLRLGDSSARSGAVGGGAPRRSHFQRLCWEIGRAALERGRRQRLASGETHSLFACRAGALWVLGGARVRAPTGGAARTGSGAGAGATACDPNDDDVGGAAKLGLGGISGVRVCALVCRSLGGFAVRAVACGLEHSLALDEAGRVWGWGLSHAPEQAARRPSRLAHPSQTGSAGGRPPASQTPSDAKPLDAKQAAISRPTLVEALRPLRVVAISA